MAAERPSVLVAERDPRLLELLERALLGRAYTVVRARSAAEALAALQQRRPSLLVIGDLELSGSELRARVRRVPHLEGLPLLLLGGAAEGELELALPKPFSGRDVGRAVQQLLQAQPAAPPAPAHTVMVIEDSAALRSLIGDILHRQGYTVLSAASVPQAEALIEAQVTQVSLVLLDVNLPGGTGFELLRRIRARSAVPVFILSALRRQDQVTQGQALGAQAFIEKPFNPRELIAKIREALT